MKFALSPTILSTYFLLNCERYLRWAAVNRQKDASLDTFEIPYTPKQHSPLFDALTQGGLRWEDELLSNHLKGKIIAVNGRIPSSKERLSYEETLIALEQIQPGQWIYQATLRPSATFIQKYLSQSPELEFRECYPDFIMCTPQGQLRIVDAKSSEHVKISHQIQIGLYALLLNEIQLIHSLSKSVDMSQGAIWLAYHAQASLVDLQALVPLLIEFLTQDIPKILEQSAEKASWHVYFKCEWCPWFNHCRQEAHDHLDLSLLPYLRPEQKRFLQKEIAPGSHLQELFQVLRNTEQADRLLAQSMTLKAKSKRLMRQTQALLEQEIISHPGISLAIPANEDIRILIALEREASSKQIYAIAIWIQSTTLANDTLSKLNLPEQTQRIWIAENPLDCENIHHQAILYLHQVYTCIDQFNRQHIWKDQLSIQSYCYEAYEHVNLRDMLLKALLSPLANQALDLLFILRQHAFESEQVPDANCQQTQHVMSFPLISVLTALREIVALPIPIAWPLGRVVGLLQTQTGLSDLDPEKFYHYPLSNYLNGDLILQAWEQDSDALQTCHLAMNNRIEGLSFVLEHIRHLPDVQANLLAQTQRFRMPQHSRFGHPILARLAWMTLNENMIRALSARRKRTQESHQRLIQQDVFALKSRGNGRFELLHPSSEPISDTYATYLLWPSSQTGEEAQALYDDFIWFAYDAHKIPAHTHRCRVKIQSVTQNPATGLVCELELQRMDRKIFLKGLDAARGTHWMLGPVYHNPLSQRIFAALNQLDRDDPAGFCALLQDVCHTSRDLPLDPELHDLLMKNAKSWGFKPSQNQALIGFLSQNISLIWGPPGTGKTHFIARTVTGLLAVHQQYGRPFRVLVTSFTRSAMINALKKTATILQTQQLSIPLFCVGQIDESIGISSIQKQDFAATLIANSQLVIAATSWQYEQLMDSDHPAIDLLIIEEASQMTVSETAQIWQALSVNTRVMIVGDHYQLPPIVAENYPEPDGDEALLTRSIFEAFQYSETLGRQKNPLARQIVFPLLECWRMNQTLTCFSAENLYKMQILIKDHQGFETLMGYACANLQIAHQRLSCSIPPQSNELHTYLLDPDYSLHLCVFEGLNTLQKNPIEAQLVAELSLLLRQAFVNHDPKPDAEFDQAFWSRNLFIVSPHHVQIQAIREALTKIHPWEYSPKVGTVDTMQGQEADCVIVSYGLSNLDAAIQEKEFIYDLNRLNVAITRARSKCLIFLSSQLLQGSPAVLDSPRAAKGLAYMQQLKHWLSQGEVRTFDLPEVAENAQLTVYRR